MIILRDVPFRDMAKFLYHNVCKLPEDEFDTRDGLADYLLMLKEIYAEPEAFETEESSASYLALLNTIKFLYGCFSVGALRSSEKGQELVVGKTPLKQVYKKGNISGIVEYLRRHGLETRYARGLDACDSLGVATDLIISHSRNPKLLAALKHLTDLSEVACRGVKDRICDEVAIFAKGDYATAAGLRSVSRSALDPLRPEILRTVGAYRDSWIQIVEALRGRAGLDCSGFMHYHVSPSWGVSFSESGERPAAIFTLGLERVFIEFTLPLSAAEGIIRMRGRYAETVRGRIESFKCVRCPKKCGGKNLSKIDGVVLCTGRAEARRIYMYLKTPKEFTSILAMVETIAEGN